MRAEVVKSMNKVAHDHNVYVSTGGWIENVLRFGDQAVDRYIEEAKALGFDVIELSTGFISLPTEALADLVNKVKNAGLKAKPELGIQFGAGGSTAAEELEAEGTKDVGWLIAQAKRTLEAPGVPKDADEQKNRGLRTNRRSTERCAHLSRRLNRLAILAAFPSERLPRCAFSAVRSCEDLDAVVEGSWRPMFPNY
jgi:phosphosulfolactate synthase (CoM biosynthesis protein A)